MKNGIYLFIIIVVVLVVVFLNRSSFTINKTPVILLTCTVNVQNGIGHLKLTESSKRKEIYLRSIKQWLGTNLNIIVVENSGYTFPELEKSDRLEIISYNEKDIYPELANEKSKGTHEIYSINHAIKNSKFIKNCLYLIKVTGRYFIPELENFILNKDFDFITQKNPEQCELIGCKKSLVGYLFNTNLEYQNNEHNNDFIEIIYKRRIENSSSKNVLRCPSFKIEPTINGSSATEVEYL